MTKHRPGQWPVTNPVDLDALNATAPMEDELYLRRQQERALQEMVMGSIRHHLEQQPSPLTVIAAARDLCNRITAAADEVARQKKKAG